MMAEEQHDDVNDDNAENTFKCWTCTVHSGVFRGPPRGVVTGGGNCPSSSLSENVRLKILNLGLKSPFLEEFRDKIEILNTHNVLCRKTDTFCRSYFLTYDAAMTPTHWKWKNNEKRKVDHKTNGIRIYMWNVHAVTVPKYITEWPRVGLPFVHRCFHSLHFEYLFDLLIFNCNYSVFIIFHIFRNFLITDCFHHQDYLHGSVHCLSDFSSPLFLRFLSSQVLSTVPCSKWN